MLKDERLERIEDYINTNRYASLAELTEMLSISKATIRRDLEQLEKQSRICLTRGGAASINKGTLYELPYVEKRNANREEKLRIAKAACQRIRSGETIMIDSGTTGYEMTEFIDDAKGVYVATNDLMTGMALTKRPNVELFIIGGAVRKGFYTANGYFAAANVGTYNFDHAFLCVDAINLGHGCMITNADEVDVKRSIIKSAKEVIVICDHTKFEATAFISICAIDQIHCVITGRELDKEIRDRFIERGCNLQLV